MTQHAGRMRGKRFFFKGGGVAFGGFISEPVGVEFTSQASATR